MGRRGDCVWGRGARGVAGGLADAGDGASAETVQAMLALCAGDHAAGRRSIADTVRVLAQMRRMVVLPDWLEHELDVLEDDHMLAVAGVRGEVGEVEARVGRFLDGRR